MPGFDGTGPLGRGPITGWRRGRCIGGSYPVSQQESAKESGAEADQITVQPAGGQVPVMYGLGRGGIPRGCGRGFCGGMKGDRDRPRGGDMRGDSEE
jgi:hypothetical protein